MTSTTTRHIILAILGYLAGLILCGWGLVELAAYPNRAQGSCSLVTLGLLILIYTTVWALNRSKDRTA